MGALGAAIIATAASAQEPAGGQDVQNGSRVFRAKGCAECHAIHGYGGHVGPDLGTTKGGRSFFEFAAAMWNHLPRMAEEMEARRVARPTLSPWEAGDLVAFLFWLGYFDEPGDSARGSELFTEKRCIRCHQVRGRGGVLGPNLDHLAGYDSPIEVAAAMWNHGPKMTQMMRDRGIARPQFSGRELRDLIAYLEAAPRSLPTGPLYVVPGRLSEGRRLFEEKHCIECHRVRNRGGTVGPDLSTDVEYSGLIDFAAEMWNKVPAMLRAMRQRDIDPPHLTPGEMAHLVEYLYAGRYFGDAGVADQGRALVGAKGCLDCHQLDGRGGTAAGDLTQARGLDSPGAVVAALWNHVNVAGSASGWSSLSAAQVADLTAYLEQLGGAQ